MPVVIAGREVKKGDTLYHVGYRAWGTVTGFDTNAAKLRITGQGGSHRTVFVTNGGVIGDRKQVYWHEPIQLDLPVQDVTTYQRALNFLVLEFGP